MVEKKFQSVEEGDQASTPIVDEIGEAAQITAELCGGSQMVDGIVEHSNASLSPKRGI